jgi:hypothetical protein
MTELPPVVMNSSGVQDGRRDVDLAVTAARVQTM